METDSGCLFLLEKIPSRRFGHKLWILTTLKRLSDMGLPHVVPYLTDINGEFISWINHGLWQLCPFVAGEALDRLTYADDPWRGDAVASFLLALHHTGPRVYDVCDPALFSIVTYCRNLFATIQQREPEVANQYLPFMEHLERHLFPVYDRLATSFCHGDLHPLNVIWKERSIRAVIDWEFCGIKPEIYDLANLLGCLGMEDPANLSSPFASRLLCGLKDTDVYTRKSWTILPDLMLAIRFAWLSEWLRKKDRPMIRLEAEYMSILMKNRLILVAG